MESRTRTRWLVAAGALLGMGALAPAAHADHVNYNLMFCADGSCSTDPAGATWSGDTLDEWWTNTDDLQLTDSTGTILGTVSQEDWDVGVKVDPVVRNNFTLTNTTSNTQTYTMTASASVDSVGADGQMKGSVGVSLTDNDSTDGQQAVVSDAGTGSSIYTALIDGNDARSLWTDMSLTADDGRTSTADTFFDFEPISEAVDSTQGIRMEFSLTPGDSVAFTSRFETVVPVPAAVWLFGSGLLGLVAVARRRARG